MVVTAQKKILVPVQNIRVSSIMKERKRSSNSFLGGYGDSELLKQKVLFAEPTGKGNLLIIEGFFGRMFRSDEGCVHDEIEEYCRQYQEMCQRLDEDPAHDYHEVLSFNDLYSLHGIFPSIAGDQWGYTNSEDWRVNLDFKIELITDSELSQKIKEPYIYYEPYEWSYPDPCYLEV